MTSVSSTSEEDRGVVDLRRQGNVVGIDFGYQNSVIAAAGRGDVKVMVNEKSKNSLTPTMVSFGDYRKMGEEAASIEDLTSNFRNTVTGAMKRLIGLEYDNPIAKDEMDRYKGLLNFCPIPHDATGGEEEKTASIGVKVQYNHDRVVIPIEQVAGMMILHLGKIAAVTSNAATEERTALDNGSSTSNDNKSESPPLNLPQDWVITIPCYWTDAQRRALLSGCRMVGISGVQRLMHENTATALEYGIFKDLRKEFSKPIRVMFIDMGASAYTVSIASFHPGKLHVLTSHWDSQLGGRDFDMLITQWLADQFESMYKGKLSCKPMECTKTRIKLLSAAEKAKKILSPHGIKEAQINLKMLQDNLDFSITLLADEYEEMCKPLLARLEKPIKDCLQEAKITSISDINIEIVGGSTRIGCVKRRLMAILGVKTPSSSTAMNADVSVARGAAIQSAILSPRFKVLPYDIEEALPYPVQIAWMPAQQPERNSLVMFDRGVSFPIVRRVTLIQEGDFQVDVSYNELAVAARYGLDPRENKSIASFKIKAPPNISGEMKVRVNIKQDIHGIICMTSSQMVEEIAEASSVSVARSSSGATARANEGAQLNIQLKKTNLEFFPSHHLEWSFDEINKANDVEFAMANIDHTAQVDKMTGALRRHLKVCADHNDV